MHVTCVGVCVGVTHHKYHTDSPHKRNVHTSHPLCMGDIGYTNLPALSSGLVSAFSMVALDVVMAKSREIACREGTASLPLRAGALSAAPVTVSTCHCLVKTHGRGYCPLRIPFSFTVFYYPLQSSLINTSRYRNASWGRGGEGATKCRHCYHIMA